MATTGEKLTAAGLVLITSLLSVGGVFLLDPDAPMTYQCVSKGLESGCINGVKASGTRCYYDPDNGRKYEYCKEGWEAIVKQLEPITTTTVPIPSGSGAKQYLCDQTKCVPI